VGCGVCILRPGAAGACWGGGGGCGVCILNPAPPQHTTQPHKYTPPPPPPQQTTQPHTYTPPPPHSRQLNVIHTIEFILHHSEDLVQYGVGEGVWRDS
jgi:hypothetical protein